MAWSAKAFLNNAVSAFCIPLKSCCIAAFTESAAVACAIVVAAGAGWGSHTGRTATERNYADLAARYAESIDPYLQVSRASAK